VGKQVFVVDEIESWDDEWNEIQRGRRKMQVWRKGG